MINLAFLFPLFINHEYKLIMNIDNHNYNSLILLLMIELIILHPALSFFIIYPLLDTITEVILLTRWNKKFFGSRRYNRIPTDVTFINTRHDFSDGSFREEWRGIPLVCPLLSQLYFLYLPFHVFSFVFFLLKPAFETCYRYRQVRHRIYEREQRAESWHCVSSIAPIKFDFIGSSFPYF